jgi:hypothetical protein
MMGKLVNQILKLRAHLTVIRRSPYETHTRPLTVSLPFSPASSQEFSAFSGPADESSISEDSSHDDRGT